MNAVALQVIGAGSHGTGYPSHGTTAGGHVGGNHHLGAAFLNNAVGRNRPSAILSGPEETIKPHLATFAAKPSRREGRVVQLEAT